MCFQPVSILRNDLPFSVFIAVPTVSLPLHSGSISHLFREVLAESDWKKLLLGFVGLNFDRKNLIPILIT